MSTRRFDHAANSPTLHVQEAIAVLCRGSQEPLRLLLEVILSALTTLEGFGTLALAVNRGIACVGLVALVGISACLFTVLSTLLATLQIWGAQHLHEEHGSCAWVFSLCWRCSSSALRVQKSSATRSQGRRKRPF